MSTKSEYSRKWRESHPEYDREWYKKNRSRCIEHAKKWAKDNPNRRSEISRESAKRRREDIDYVEKLHRKNKAYRETNKAKISAKNKLNYALRKGLITKPDTCSECGDVTSRIEAYYHRGYDHPLDVLWVCTRCHVKLRND